MTDDSNARYRSSDPYGQAPAPSEQGADPLAELARLIGQTSREPRPEPRDDHRYDEPAAYADQHERPAYDPRYDTPLSHDAAFAHDAAHPAPEWQSQPAHAEPQWQSEPAPSFDPFTSAQHQRPLDPPNDHRYQEPVSQPRYQEPERAERYQEPQSQLRAHAPDLSFLSAHSDQSRHAAAPQEQAHHDTFVAPSFDPPPRPPQSFSPNSMSDPGPMPPPNADEYYDDPPSRGRRRGLVTVMAVLCLAVVGTGAAFGYRTYFGGPAVKGPAPVIRASAEPSKVAPPPQADPKDTNKISYDRFADRGQNEQVVPREERPVDVREAARSGPPRAVAMGAANASGTPAAVAQAANPPSVLTEPKRVRTVPIRPDAPDTSAARPQMVAAVPPPPRQSAPAANAPLDLANPVAPPAARASAPPMRAAAARPAPEPPPGTAPMSLAPDAPAAARAPAPTRVASAPATGGGSGNYLVQVSSQRSEADAQAAYRSVKSKYSGVLGDRQPVIRRADLAGKGTYYRAMVGPFTTRDEAIQLCSSLKAAGGDCVVQAN